MKKMNWEIVNTKEDLARLDQSVCWEDSETIEYYATIRNYSFFPDDVSRSGYQNKNIFILCSSYSAPGPFLEMVFIDCDRCGPRFLDNLHMNGRVDSLKRVEIENYDGETVMRCSRLIFRFLEDNEDSDLYQGDYYRKE
jgi:hypothetical protein